MPTQTNSKIRVLIIITLAAVIISCVLMIILSLIFQMLGPTLQLIVRWLNDILYYVFFVAFPLLGFLTLLFPKAVSFRNTEQEFYVPLGPTYWGVKSLLGLVIIFMASSTFLESIVERPYASTNPYYELLNYSFNTSMGAFTVILGTLMLFFPKHLIQVVMNLLPVKFTNKIDLNPSPRRMSWGLMRFMGAVWLVMALFGLYSNTKSIINFYR